MRVLVCVRSSVPSMWLQHSAQKDYCRQKAVGSQAFAHIQHAAHNILVWLTSARAGALARHRMGKHALDCWCKGCASLLCHLWLCACAPSDA